MAIELQFYVVFPFLLMMWRRTGTIFLVALIAFFIFIRWTIWMRFGTVHHLSMFSIFGNLDVFLIGMLLGRLYKVEWQMRYNGALLLIALLVAYNVLIAMLFQGEMFHGHATAPYSKSAWWIVWTDIQGLFWAVFIFCYMKADTSGLPSLILISQRTISAVLAALGTWSYSIYVWQILTLQFLNLQGMPSWLPFKVMSPYFYGAFAVLPFTIAVAFASYYLIERPFLAMRVKYTATKT